MWLPGLLAYFVVIAAVCLLAWKIWQSKMYYWLWPYFKWCFRKINRMGGEHPTHIMFLIVDHFEPTKQENIDPWLKHYPEIALKYRDADGCNPRYTWAFPIEQYQVNRCFVDEISRLCFQGLGEIEMHLHHFGDDFDSLKKKLVQGIELFQQHGIFKTIHGETAFGFVHGNWSLCNSVCVKGEDRCGVNNELGLLKGLGCFADFTFPSMGSMAQPAKINSIYYARDNDHPKSYNDGVDVQVGKEASPGLMLLQGPLFINWKQWFASLREGRLKWWPQTDAGHLQNSASPSAVRVDQWVRAGVHVKGRPQWIFIKTHTHGASPVNWRMLLEENGLNRLFDYLVKKYNDGVKYKLHFVTAREAYNIVKAAENGMQGDPGNYRDFIVKPYENCNNESAV